MHLKDEMLAKFSQFDSRLTSVGKLYIPRDVLLILWDSLIKSAFVAIIEGLSKVKKVSQSTFSILS
jgi:hypothetical protein